MTDIPSIPFADPDRADRTLATLHDLFLTSGSTFGVDEFSRELRTHLAASPDADMALMNLLRFVEAVLSKEALFNDLLRYPIQFELLMKLLGYSQYFSDILVRDPELFRWLTVSDSLVNTRSREYYSAETERVLRIFQKPERKLDGLRRLQRREILRIGARDILGESDLKAITLELSLLADSMIEACCRIAALQLEYRFPHPPNTEYSIIGLGKLGGAELNYSSDIDLMLVYRSEGESEDSRGKSVTHLEYFHAFAEKLIHNLAQNSGEGHLYRVDFRLRPEGRMSPLARSLESYLLYYEARGELWERQMLIKARPVGGDSGFGREFLQAIQAFVYPRTHFHNPVLDIARMKARIEAAIGDEENVKLRAGGIRDIEFIAQALQIVSGGKNESHRMATTLDAIDQLASAGLLSDEERATLTEGYVFLRTIEHRLQTMHNAQTHEMPGDRRTLNSLAKRVGLPSGDALLTEYETTRAKVRRIFDAVLSVSKPQGSQNLFSLLSGGGDAAQFLGRFGFRDTRKAARALGSVDCGDSFRSVVDTLLADMAKTPAPDMTLQNLVTVAGAQKFPEQFFHHLQEENFRRLLVTICAMSPRCAKGIARNPLALETLLHRQQTADLASDPEGAMGRPLRTVKTELELQSAIRYVLGVTSFDEMTIELSHLADAVVTRAVTSELKRSRMAKQAFAVFALGKYGTREINFDSDLDVLFIADVASASTKDRLEKAATRIVAELSAVAEGGRMYEIDARLRPEGKSAPLVVDRKAYVAYLQHRASLWERQSLTRLRFVAGDPILGQKACADVASFVYDSVLPGDWVNDVITMRRKTETRSKVGGQNLLDVKLSAGGMVDIEFLAQMLQLRFGRDTPTLRHLPALQAIQSSPLSLSHEEIVEAYRLYRRIEALLRLTLEERANILPENEKLELLAKLLSFSSGKDLHDRVAWSMKTTREIFLNITGQLT